MVLNCCHPPPAEYIPLAHRSFFLYIFDCVIQTYTVIEILIEKFVQEECFCRLVHVVAQTMFQVQLKCEAAACVTSCLILLQMYKKL